MDKQKGTEFRDQKPCTTAGILADSKHAQILFPHFKSKELRSRGGDYQGLTCSFGTRGHPLLPFVADFCPDLESTIRCWLTMNGGVSIRWLTRALWVTLWVVAGESCMPLEVSQERAQQAHLPSSLYRRFRTSFQAMPLSSLAIPAKWATLL